MALRDPKAHFDGLLLCMAAQSQVASLPVDDEWHNMTFLFDKMVMMMMIMMMTTLTARKCMVVSCSVAREL